MKTTEKQDEREMTKGVGGGSLKWLEGSETITRAAKASFSYCTKSTKQLGMVVKADLDSAGLGWEPRIPVSDKLPKTPRSHSL